MNVLFGVGLIVLVLLISPLLTLWGLNTISEQGTMGWYVPHNLWTYLAVYAVIMPIASSKSK